MGPLKSMKYGSLVKAVYKFTMVRQNFGELPAIALISSSEVCISSLHNVIGNVILNGENDHTTEFHFHRFYPTIKCVILCS